MFIYLVRHASYQNPDKIIPIHMPVQLSEKGRQQAHSIGHYFQHKQIKLLVTSPILRAVQTGQIINQYLHIHPHTDQRFQEVFNPQVQGQPRQGLDQCIYTLPGGESLDVIRNRMLDGFNEVKNKKQNAIIVSHGDPITILYHTLIEQPVPTKPANGKDCFIPKGHIVELNYPNGDKLFDHKITCLW